MDASTVETPVGNLAGVEVLDEGGDLLGRIEGVIIEPAARRIRYFAIQTPGLLRRRRLLHADELTQVEADRKALRLLVSSEAAIARDLDPSTVRRFSDADLLTTLFAPQAA